MLFAQLESLLIDWAKSQGQTAIFLVIVLFAVWQCARATFSAMKWLGEKFLIPVKDEVLLPIKNAVISHLTSVQNNLRENTECVAELKSTLIEMKNKVEGLHEKVENINNHVHEQCQGCKNKGGCNV